MMRIDIGDGFAAVINWMTTHMGGFFDGVSSVILALVNGLTFIFELPNAFVMIAILTVIAWFSSGKKMALFTVLGMLLIQNLGLWSQTMETLSLIVAAVIFSLAIGLPLGIWSAKSDTVERVMRPAMDFMQTLPAFVYLIPAVMLFSLGPVPGVLATLIFSLPPVARLTNLGIRQVPKEIKEAAIAFGSSPWQILFKAELPQAIPTIMAGVNQTIMLALSMVVIAGMIGAGGLGNEVLKGITQLRLNVGFEGGVAIVILAVYLDRVTQALGGKRNKSKG
ncbi:ABC transporter permease [Dongshaea marina]|uniref:ABC transporter permease n=1 Tax=Dongshaea marina TaxID=2047966 RepID=UPI000D3ECF9B|nr:proline/glycine betaine ABC transporter permease [Dongshaea marina]